MKTINTVCYQCVGMMAGDAGEWLGIITTFVLKQPATRWQHPGEPVSLSEAGLERICRCSVIAQTGKTRLLKDVKYHITQKVRRLP